jgi:hypothetical protein
VQIDGLGRAPKIDLETKNLDRGALQAVDAILSSGRQAGGLNLELGDLADAERHHDHDEAREHQDDDHEHHRDGRGSRQPYIDQPDDARLNQECDQGAKDERAQEIAEQVEDDDRDRERREPEGDLKVTPPLLRVERPS